MEVSPTSVSIESSTACQLKCPLCPTAQGLVKSQLGTGFLKPEHLATFLDKNPTIRHVELSNWGEAFLSPHLEAILKLAFERGVGLSCSNGANFNHVSESVLEALVKYRFARITFSIDGATPEVYAQYRRQGDLNRVLTNIRRLNEIKARHGSSLPRLTWQYVVFRHNEHEIARAEALARSLDMDFYLKTSWSLPDSPEKAVDQAAKNKRFYIKTSCTMLWNRTQINYDGRVLGCCVNTWGDFGNAFESDFSSLVNGPRMHYARAMLTGQKKARLGIPCTSCDTYESMRKANRFLDVKPTTDGGYFVQLVPGPESRFKRAYRNAKVRLQDRVDVFFASPRYREWASRFPKFDRALTAAWRGAGLIERLFV